VRLEPLRDEHRDPLWAIARDERIWAFMRLSAHESRERFDEWWSTVDMGFAHYFDGGLVGHTSFLNHRREDKSVEIGNTWVVPAAFGSGANAGAKYLLLRHAFEEEGLLRVEFKTDAVNERARRALAGIPAAFEGVHRKHMLVRGGQRRDSAWYSVTDDEWPVVKAELEKRIG
jgi:RimJ/RimL family protein N-acetyltransferase